MVSSLPIRLRSHVIPLPHHLAGGGESDDSPRAARPFGRRAPEHEELPYKVELWDETRSSVELVLAVTANGSIGYAAYYAATREYPDRYVTLRHKNSIVSRWNAPSH
ncbi:MAG: hypothetical protein ACOY4R_06975 [Pseudomonadota bacterium]